MSEPGQETNQVHFHCVLVARLTGNIHDKNNIIPVIDVVVTISIFIKVESQGHVFDSCSDQVVKVQTSGTFWGQLETA